MAGRAVFVLLITVLAATGAGAAVEEVLARVEKLIAREQFAEAEKTLASAKAQHPGNVEVLYRLGYVQYRQRKLQPAAVNLRAVVKLAPSSLPARYFLGRIALLENRAAQAVSWLEPVVGSGEAVFDAPAQLGRAYSELGQHRRALAALRAAAAQAPWDGSVFYRLGRTYERLGEKALAAEALATSQRLNSANRELVEKLMRCSEALRKGERAAALAVRDEVLAGSDAGPDALVALGATLAGGGMHREAAEVFARAAGREASLYQAQYNLGLSRLKLGDMAGAEEPLAAAVRLLPSAPEANAALGTVYVIGGRFAEAVPLLERAHAGDPELRQVPGLLGVAYLRTGQGAKAAALVKAAVKSAPEDPRLWFLLVEALNAAEDPEGALEAAQAAQQKFAAMPQANLALGQQLARVGRYAEAGPLFERVLSAEPGHPHALLGLAESLEKRGEAERALEVYRRASAAGVLAQLGVARSLVLLRRLEEARGELESAAAREPRNQQVRIELARVYARLGMKEEAAEQNRVLQELRVGR